MLCSLTFCCGVCGSVIILQSSLSHTQGPRKVKRMHRPKGEIINVVEQQITMLQGDPWLTKEERNNGDNQWSKRGKPPAEWTEESLPIMTVKPKGEKRNNLDKKKEKKGKRHYNEGKENMEVNRGRGPVRTLYPKAGMTPPPPKWREEKGKNRHSARKGRRRKRRNKKIPPND